MAARNPRPTDPSTPGRWVPISQAGEMLRPPVAYQAVQQWIAIGFSAVRRVGNRTLVNLDALEAWRHKFRGDPDDPGHGGRRAAGPRSAGPPGGKRRSASNAVESAAHDALQESLFEPRKSIAVTERAVLERAERGDFTVVDLKMSNEAAKLLDRIRESAKETGRLLDAEEAEREATAVLIAVRTRLDQLPPRIEKRCVTDLGLSASSAKAVRAMLGQEVRAACEALAAWKAVRR